MSNGFELIRDPGMDKMFEEIIDIFNNVEGVELVRLSGMTNYCRKVSGKHDIPPMAIDSIIRKMNEQNVIKFKSIVKCPHCGEVSYMVKQSDEFLTKAKFCDTCNSFYALLEGSTLEKEKVRD